MMKRIPYNDDWLFAPLGSIFESAGDQNKQRVTLPHDAMLAGGRSKDGSDGSSVGYFSSGAWQYKKSFEVPEQWADKRVVFEFEGVYRDAMVYINGAYAGQHSYGYSRFYIPANPYLDYGQTNTITVECRAHRDSRWYSGAGMIRPVNLLVGDLVHITAVGPRVTPSVCGGDGTVEVDTDVVNDSVTTRTVTLETSILSADGKVCNTERTKATILAGETAGVHQRLYVADPALWDVEHPNLYRLEAKVLEEDAALDETSAEFGFRTLELDPRHGLRINGQPVKLRGACVHPDSGILGAATFDAAEERRVRLLKAAGFNAIRSSHNPLSRAMLEAADRVGMLVMDETFDMWHYSKNADDYSGRFEANWRQDTDAMVVRDYNHPSVILYSVGNEILESGDRFGARQARLLADEVRSLDSTRFVTSAINGAMAARDELMRIVAQSGSEKQGFNAILSTDDATNELMGRPEVGAVIEETAGALDVVGLNYGELRYQKDHKTHPNRIFVGSETFPSKIDRLWALVSELPYVLGDFTWTGWDYLGETGLGNPKYPGEEAPFAAPYPALTGNCGDIDIIGVRQPISYYREIVFGLRKAPYIAVEDPAHAENPAVPQGWSWSDAKASWNWDIAENTPVTVEVYADADEVALVLNGEEKARASVGEERNYMAKAVIPYLPGTLSAISYRNGEKVGETQLKTTGKPAEVRLSAFAPEHRELADDIKLVEISVLDADGQVCQDADLHISVSVFDGTLQGLGTGRSVTEESFLADSCTTYEGRALAAVRPGEGDCRIAVSAPGVPEATLDLS
ncbi:glycoside hydrolase family 2 TIM barrel-domain containing protein [Bifidobacterium sp. ESL0800]|uniref:glycoside hydrolase family 2 TIM barrel-domain containing protein n=1 Tax=Bifidobacterium sp. ESL0800 TaxID=2983236 RepID=UPI0023F70971|nr:glycoside hydrolase family 2 TIM barrel-domain containing protein [Bifidobacterium sp. ESL0800]WEV75321.1 DUF4982 domain-containing protein [Bifidobacterium sp. ESL0800]